MLQVQQMNHQNASAQNGLKDSKMQPIKMEDKGSSSQGQDESASKSLADYHPEHGYQNFTYQLRGIKREYLRPLTHI